MTGGEDWLLRPVIRGKCQYESLINGVMSLCDVAILNEAIDVEDENQYRYHQAVKDSK